MIEPKQAGLSKLIGKEREKSRQTHGKEANRSKVKRDRDLKDKATEKRCRSQPRDRGKVAGKRKEISKKQRGQGGG